MVIRAATLALLALGGCVRTGRVSAEEFGDRHLPFLREEGLTLKRVVAALGPPTHRFEGGRIVGYRLLLSWEGVVSRVSKLPNEDVEEVVQRQGEYSLVLVCGPDDRISDHRLTRVRP